MLSEKLNIKNQYELIRLGKDNDGGYLVEKNSILESDILISAGIFWDYSFEEDYIKLVNKPVSCFDHTINFKHYFVTWILIFISRVIKFSSFTKLKAAYNNILKPIKLRNFFKKDLVKYFKLGVGLKNDKIIELTEIFELHRNFQKIFLKIDIERDEYRLLDEIVNNTNLINGLIIEFHDFDLNIKRIEEFVKNLDLELVHLHPNNSGPTNKEGIPTIVELSFAKNPKIIGERLTIKHHLDQPNLKNKKDIEIIFQDS